MAKRKPKTARLLRKSPDKNPAAVALGRLGGLKGGKARAQRLSAKRRKQIARHAAQRRWAKFGRTQDRK